MAKTQVSPRFFLLPVLGLLAAACSSSESDDRPQVLVDLQLGAGVSAPQSVIVSATQAAVVVKTFTIPWNTTNNPKRLVFPSSITGQVTISATATTNNSPVAQGQIAEPVTLTKGETAGPYTLVLNATNPTGEDGGIKDSGADRGATEIGPTGAEVGDSAPANPSPDAGADAGADAVLADAALDRATGDTFPSIDVPSGGEDAKDAPLGLSDTPLAPDAPDGAVLIADATTAIEAGHALAWEPAVNVQSDLKTCYGTVVAVDPINEHVYAAWVDDATIKVRRWNRQTAAWEKTVTLESRGNPNTPSIGVDVKGNVMALWPQDTSGVTASLDGVWMSRTTDGTSWSPPVRIATGAAYGVTLAMARNGSGHAAYSKKDGGYWSLFTAYYDGTSWAESSTPIESKSNYGDFEPQIALGALGDGLMIYAKGWGVAGTVLTGTTFTDPLMLDPNNETISAYNPAVAVNRKGEGIVVWTEYTGGSTVIIGRSYSPATKWSSVVPPIVTEDTVADPAVALDEQGNVTLVWQQYIAAGGFNLVGMHGKLDGTWGNVTILETDNRAGSATTSDHNAYPKAAIDGNGNVLVVWLKDLSEGKTTTIGAYGTRYAAGTWLPQAKLGLKTGLAVPFLTLAVADSGLGAVTFKYIDPTESGTNTDPDSYQSMVALFR